MTGGRRLVVFDMDGVIYRGGERLPHVREVLAGVRGRGLKVRFLTNNSTKTREFYVERLRGMEVEAEVEEVISSASATAWWIGKNAPGSVVYAVGEGGLKEELAKVCRVLDGEDIEGVEYVVAGLDREFDYRKLTCAASAIYGGAKFIATNRDPNFPDSGGRVIPGGGSIVAAISVASGVEPLTIGKPEPLMFELMVEAVSVKREEILLVGDRASTDVALGRRAGVETCLVLTGVTTAEEVESLPPELTPDHVISDLGGLMGILGL
ncbi:MAG: HAD-IIA family hydrolase [bacterium]